MCLISCDLHNVAKVWYEKCSCVIQGGTDKQPILSFRLEDRLRLTCNLDVCMVPKQSLLCFTITKLQLLILHSHSKQLLFKKKDTIKKLCLSLAYQNKCTCQTDQDFTTQGGGIITTFVHRGHQNQKKMKVPSCRFKEREHVCFIDRSLSRSPAYVWLLALSHPIPPHIQQTQASKHPFISLWGDMRDSTVCTSYICCCCKMLTKQCWPILCVHGICNNTPSHTVPAGLHTTT